MVISASLQACGVVFPFAMLTSICRSIVTICSGLYLLIGMTRFSSKWILSHSTWYKFRRSGQKTLRVSHIPTPPTTTTDNCPTKRYTNIPLGTKDRSGQVCACPKGGRECGQSGMLGRYSSAIRAACANERSCGSVRGAISDDRPYRDLVDPLVSEAGPPPRPANEPTMAFQMWLGTQVPPFRAFPSPR